MKKILTLSKWLFISLLALLFLVLSIPFLFENKIKDIALRYVNEELDAQITIEDLNLSLLSHFPDFTLEIQNIVVKSPEDFGELNLATIKSFDVRLGLLSVLSGEIEVKSIELIDPEFNVRVHADGKANYMLNKTNNKTAEKQAETIEAKSEKTTEKKQAFLIQLKNYKLENLNLHYIDEKGKLEAHIENLNHQGEGNFTKTQFDLNTQTKIDGISVKKGGINYLYQLPLDAKLTLGIDLDKKNYTFKENEIRLGGILLKLDGFVQMEEDNILSFANFSTGKLSFEELIAMLPQKFKTNLKGATLKGTFELGGTVNGSYNENAIPAFDIQLLVENGEIQYPKLPQAIRNIQIDASVKRNEGKDLDNTVVAVKKFYLELAESPVEAQLKLKTPLSDPNIDAMLKMDLNLAKLKDIMPLEKEDLITGKLAVNASLNGKQSYLDKKEFEKFLAQGTVHIENIKYHSSSIPKPVNIHQLLLQLNPQYISLENLDLNIGSSDIQMKGKITDYLQYIMKKGPIKGLVFVQSEQLQLNDLVAEKKQGTTEEGEVQDDHEKEKETPKEAMKLISIPEKIDLKTQLNLKKITYGKLLLENIEGKLGLKNETAYMKKLHLQTLDGSVNINGTYNSQKKKNAELDFKLEIENINIQKTKESFDVVKKMIPADIYGNFSSNMSLQTQLDEQMNPVYPTLYSQGNIKTSKITIKNFKALEELSKLTKNKEYAEPKINTISLSYRIEKGVIHLDPTSFNIDNIPFVVHGTNDLKTETLNLKITAQVPRKKLGSEINKGLDQLLSQAKQLGISTTALDYIPVSSHIKGSITNPRYQFSYGGTSGGSAKDYLKEQSGSMQKELQNSAKKELEKKAQEELKKKKAELKKEGKKELEKEVNKIIDKNEILKKNKKDIEKALKGLFK